MIVTKGKIAKAVEAKKAEYQEWAKTHWEEMNGQVVCIFVQETADHKYHVGWRFTPTGTQVGEIQQDAHNTAFRNQEIVWVAKNGTTRTMAEANNGWAEQYRGSGRLTGLTAKAPVFTNTGEVAPGWTYVGDMTEAEFWDTAESEQIGR